MIRKLMSLCLLVIAASAYAQTQPSPPWGPATSSSGTYNINWNSSASGTATILEERIGGSTTWIPIDTRLYQFSGNYYMAFTNKAAGQYYYRINVAYATPYGVTWMSSNQILVTVGSGGTPPPSADSLSNQRAYVYETRRGDLNGDGRLDLFVNLT